MKFTKTHLVSWEEMHRQTKAMAAILNEIDSFSSILCVTRGGLVPAAIIARELNIRIVETVSVVRCKGSDKNPEFLDVPKIVKPAINIGDGEGWLVIEDLVDTGKTVDLLRQLYPKAHFAAVFAKPMGKPLLDTCMVDVSQTTWIYLPWDMDLQFSEPLVELDKPILQIFGS